MIQSGGQGVPPPSGKPQVAIGSLKNTGTDPLPRKGVQLLLVGGMYDSL